MPACSSSKAAKAKIVEHNAARAFGIRAFGRDADEAIKLETAQGPRVVDRLADAVLKLSYSVGEASDPALASCPVAGRKVVKHLDKPARLQRLRKTVLVEGVWKQELDALEAFALGGGEPVDEVVLSVEQGQVGREFWHDGCPF